MYEPIESLTRRRFLSEMGLGFGSVALATMLEGEANGAPLVTPLPKAKNVIWLFMIGGASHLETFDPKPDAPVEVRGPLDTIKTNVPLI